MGTLESDATLSQCDMILRYMTENGGITAAEAVDEIGCYRLSSRIWDLKQAGHSIKKERLTKKNRYGKMVSYAKYTLEEQHGV